MELGWARQPGDSRTCSSAAGGGPAELMQTQVRGLMTGLQAQKRPEGRRGASPAQSWLPVGDLWDSPFWLVSNHLEAVQEGKEYMVYSSQIPLLSTVMSDASWDTWLIS